MDIPWPCGTCGEENWIDLDRLDEWPLDRLVSAMGFVCEKCGMREAISLTTTSLKEAERKLMRYKPTHPKFPWYFGKLVTKQTGVNARGDRHGASKQTNMAIPG